MGNRFSKKTEERTNSLTDMEDEPASELMQNYLRQFSEPDNTEPDNIEPDDTEPDDTEPDDTEPDNIEPDDSEPDNIEPDNIEPDNIEPDDSEPDDNIILHNNSNTEEKGYLEQSINKKLESGRWEKEQTCPYWSSQAVDIAMVWRTKHATLREMLDKSMEIVDAPINLASIGARFPPDDIYDDILSRFEQNDEDACEEEYIEVNSESIVDHKIWEEKWDEDEGEEEEMSDLLCIADDGAYHHVPDHKEKNKQCEEELQVGAIIEIKIKEIWTKGKIISKKKDMVWVCPETENIDFQICNIYSSNIRSLPIATTLIKDNKYVWANIGERVDVLDMDSSAEDAVSVWREAIIISFLNNPKNQKNSLNNKVSDPATFARYKVHYCSWNKSWDAWVDPHQIRPAYTMVKDWRSSIKTGDFLEYKRSNSKWYYGEVESVIFPMVYISDLRETYAIQHKINSDDIALKGTHRRWMNDMVYQERKALIWSSTQRAKTWLKEICDFRRSEQAMIETVGLHRDICESSMDGIFWRHFLYVGGNNNFSSFGTTVSYIRRLFPDGVVKIIILDEFVKKHMLKYRCQEEDNKQNYALIGKRVKVRWSMTTAYGQYYIVEWFKGFISDYDGDKHTIIYDDGQKRSYDLSTIGYEILDMASFGGRLVASEHQNDEKKEY